jgi:hypothetical protein
MGNVDWAYLHAFSTEGTGIDIHAPGLGLELGLEVADVTSELFDLRLSVHGDFGIVEENPFGETFPSHFTVTRRHADTTGVGHEHEAELGSFSTEGWASFD